MNYRILERSDGYVEIDTSGTMTFSSIKQMVHEVVDTVRRTGISKYMFNFMGTRVDVNPFETCELFDMVTGLKINSELKIAFIYVYELHDHRHAENVGINRGYHIRGFQGVDEAIDWLL